MRDLNIRLDQFYKDMFKDAQEREKRHNEVHIEMLKKIDGLSKQLEPVTELFDNVGGFKQVSLSIIKGIIAIGAGVGVIYGFIMWLRN